MGCLQVNSIQTFNMPWKSPIFIRWALNLDSCWYRSQLTPRPKKPMDHHARMSASRRVNASGGSVRVRSCTFYTNFTAVIHGMKRQLVMARFMLEHMGFQVHEIHQIHFIQNLWLIFGCKPWGCFKLLHRSSVGHPKRCKPSNRRGFWLEELRMCSKKRFTLDAKNTPFSKAKFFDTTLLIFFHLFSWFRSSDTSGWWLQVYQFWCHSLTSKIFFPIEFINSSLWRHSRFRNIFQHIFSIHPFQEISWLLFWQPWQLWTKTAWGPKFQPKLSWWPCQCSKSFGSWGGRH